MCNFSPTYFLHVLSYVFLFFHDLLNLKIYENGNEKLNEIDDQVLEHSSPLQLVLYNLLYWVEFWKLGHHFFRNIICLLAEVRKCKLTIFLPFTLHVQDDMLGLLINDRVRQSLPLSIPCSKEFQIKNIHSEYSFFGILIIIVVSASPISCIS